MSSLKEKLKLYAERGRKIIAANPKIIDIARSDVSSGKKK